MKRFMTPDEITGAVVEMGVKKAGLKIEQSILLSIFAGVFVGFGAHASLTVMQTLKGIDAGIMKFMGGAVFPVGLMLVILAGGELFTSNNLLTVAVLDRKLTIKKTLKNWIIVYFGNFAGSIILAVVLYYSGLYGSGDMLTPAGALAKDVAAHKVEFTFMEAFFRGIMCNILVVLAVWIVTGAQDVVSKIFACWFPVMLFVLSGFEHSIANMYYLTLGYLLNPLMDLTRAVFSNLIPATLGNIVGGALIVPFVYYFALHKPKNLKLVEKKRQHNKYFLIKD